MKKFTCVVFFVSVLTLSAVPAMSFDGLGLSGGYSSSEEVSFFRGAIKFDPEWKFFDQQSWFVSIHFDLGLIFMNSHSDTINTTGAPDSLGAISFTPVFRLQRAPYANTIAPFFEAAVGAAFFSEDQLQNPEPIGLELGGTFQFEDMLSVGCKFGENQQFEASVNYLHYSNFGFYDKNDGIDITSATLTVWF